MMVRHKYELAAGIFLLAAMALFALSVWVLGREREIFAEQREYFTMFRDVKGLAVGAPVRLGGITIGRVAEIGFSSNLQDPSIHVKLLINEQYLERLHVDSKVSLETQGLLGDRFLSISTGQTPKQLLPGATIQSIEASDMADILEKAGRIAENTVKISESADEFFRKFKDDTLVSLTEASQHIAALTKEIEQGSGLLHRLIYSKKDGDDIMKMLTDTSADLRGIMRGINEGDGLLNALIHGEEGGKTLRSLSQTAENLGTAAAHISEMAQEIKSGQGIAHDLIYGGSPEGLAAIIEKLNQTVENLRLASEALSKGSGTLGALLVDPQLYDNLVEVTDEAKRSLILREAIRASLGK